MTADDQKKAAAIAALEFVQAGNKVGLGTGSTANHFITALADKARGGFDVECVASSRASFQLASGLGLRMTTLEKQPHLDVTVDGTDEFDGNFQLVKGGGGALLVEKIVATSSRYMVVIADQSKKVDALGKFPLAVEVVPFGVNATAWKIDRALRICDLKGKLQLRLQDGKPFVTDSGNAIIDVTIGHIPEPRRLDNLIKSIPGVVDHGLFIDICGIVLMGTDDGVKTFRQG